MRIIKRKKKREAEHDIKEAKTYIVSKDEISKKIDDNIKYIKDLLVDNDDIVFREFYCMNVRCTTIFVDGLVSRELIDRDVIRHLMLETKMIDKDITGKNVYDRILNDILATSDIVERVNMKDAVLDLLSGETLLFVDGFDKIIRISTRSWPNRGIQQPITENAVRGPRDSFNEVVRFSTALVRRRIRDTRLRVKNTKIGRRSQTDIYLVYIDDIVDKDVLNEVTQRL